MRQIDPEPVREAVAAFKLGSAAETLALHEAERWREELMASDDAVTRWMADHPETDAQQLRNLLRAARKDAGKAAPADGQGQRHGRAYRDLFQLIKSALTGRAAPPAEAGDGEDDDVEPLEPVRIGVVSISDRASSGVYEDKGIPALQDWLGRAAQPHRRETRLIPDEQDTISAALRELVDTPAATWCSPPAAPARRRAT
jgi:hypothetical protein